MFFTSVYGASFWVFYVSMGGQKSEMPSTSSAGRRLVPPQVLIFFQTTRVSLSHGENKDRWSNSITTRD